MSFVEKALNRLKQQQGSPPNDVVGELRYDERPKRPPVPPAGTEPADPRPVRPPGARPKVSLDRERLSHEGFLVPEEYQRRMADEYRRIKRPLLANAFGLGAPKAEEGNLILVTSAVAGEGKTHTCINLALSLATERERTVLLVDGDVAKPHISRIFGVADEPGILDVLANQQASLSDAIIRTDIESLSVLPAGRWNDHATELLASERMRQLAQELSTRYPDRIILFDSPPLLAATEAQALASIVGQVVLVIAEGLTSRQAVHDALQLVDERKPVNAVLNKSRRQSSGSHYYGYGAYAYRSYGDAEEARREIA